MKIVDVKYDPDKKCTILYREGDQLITAILKENEKLPQLYSFPNDPVLTWLPMALDKEHMSAKLNTTIQNISTISYTPLMRASFAFEMDSLSLIGKTNAFYEPVNVFQNVNALWEIANGKIGMAKPVLYLNHPPMTLQEKLDGSPLSSLVKTETFTDILEETAKTIAQFHRLPLQLPKTRTIQHEIRSLNRWYEVLINICPELKNRLVKLRNKIVSAMERCFTVQGPVHADFHPSNVLVNNMHVYLIDLEQLANGDPCADIGRFLSSLRTTSLKVFGNISASKEHRDHFLESYLKIFPQNATNIHVYESAALFTSAAYAYRCQRPNWKDEVKLLVKEAEKIVI